jgi:ferritin-like metal-binding protein YciE
MSLESMQDLLLNELRDLYSAEKQLVKALPKMAKAARFAGLKDALQDHLDQTRGHVARLDEAFRVLDASGGGKKCKGMEGLIEEGDEMCDEDGDDSVRDAGIIAAAQRVEHYEIAGYGCAIAFAKALGEDEVAALLTETREEEEAADEKLTTLAEESVNPAALGAGTGFHGEE